LEFPFKKEFFLDSKHHKKVIMKKIEAVIRKSKFEDVKKALYDVDIDWFSYWDITGLGKSREDQVVRGQVFKSSYTQRRMLSIVVRDVNLEKTVNAIMSAARTGERGDGKVFVSDIEETYRIRNGEKGPEALYNKDDK
jgi:nitrogen regulatory protein P-II 1